MPNVSAETFTNNANAALKGYEELVAVGKGNLDAVVASGQAALKGLEAINREVMTFTQAQFSEGVEAGRAIARAKDLPEAIELQTSYVRTATEKAFAQLAKLSQLSSQVVAESLRPLQPRASENAQKFNQQAAA